MTRYTWMSALMAVGLLAAAPDSASAQTVTLEACYVPGSGTVYRINAEGAPDDCRSHRHVRFTWSTSIPTGFCPDGEFMVGISEGGEIVCAAPADGGSGGPFHSGFEGRYQLTPALVLECEDETTIDWGDLQVEPGSAHNQIDVDLLSSFGFPLFLHDLWGLEAEYDPATTSFSLEARVEPTADSYLDLDLSGDFEGQTVTVDVSMEVLFESSFLDAGVCTMTGQATGQLQ